MARQGNTIIWLAAVALASVAIAPAMADAHSQSYDYEDELPRAGGRNSAWSPRIPQSNGLEAGNGVANGDGGAGSISSVFQSLDIVDYCIDDDGYGWVLLWDWDNWCGCWYCLEDSRPSDAVKKKASRMGLRKSKKYMKSLGRS